MASDPLVRGYAESLFLVAQAEGLLDRVEEELTRLIKTLDSSPDLKEFLGSTRVASEGKTSALREIFGKGASPVTSHWLACVVDQGRQRRLPAMIEDFFLLAQESREKVTAEVITCVPLSEDLTHRLEAELSKISRKRVFLKPIVDESILGGVIVRIENKVIDGSVRHRLEEIKKEMTKTH